MKKKTSLFESVIKKALFASIVGLFVGLALGMVIWSIVHLLATKPDGPPRELAAFLGMGFGTVLGAVFGGIIGMKEVS